MHPAFFSRNRNWLLVELGFNECFQGKLFRPVATCYTESRKWWF